MDILINQFAWGEISTVEAFTSKIDKWLLVVLWVTVAIALGGGFLAAREGGASNSLSALVLIVIGAVMPIWVLFGTNYTVTERELLVRSGPVFWRIPIAAIASVKETQDPRSSPALSLDRLRINYGNGQSVLVSPQDPHRFRMAIGHPQE